MKVIKFKDFNIDNFTAFLKSASIAKSAHSIDFKQDKVSCKAFPMDTKYVKFTSIIAGDILQFVDYPDDIQNIVVKLASLKKIQNAMEVFSAAKIEKVSGEMHVELTRVAGHGHHACNHIKFKSPKSNLTVRCDEDNLIKCMPDTAWEAFSSTATTVCKFDIDAVSMAQLEKLINIDKQNAIIVEAGVDTACLKSKNIGGEIGMWDMQVDVNYNNVSGVAKAFNISKLLIGEVANKSYYTAYICQVTMGGNMKHTVVLRHDDHNIIVGMANEETI